MAKRGCGMSGRGGQGIGGIAVIQDALIAVFEGPNGVLCETVVVQSDSNEAHGTKSYMNVTLKPARKSLLN